MPWTSEQKARAKRIRAAQGTLIPLAADNPATVNQITAIIPAWTSGKYVVGDVRLFKGIPCKCVQAHDSGQNPSWTPEVASLWMQYHGTSVETARPYLQPQGAHDAYQKNEYIIWTDGKVYRSKVDANVYSPKDYAANWEKQA